jgi:hypothetical protein
LSGRADSRPASARDLESTIDASLTAQTQALEARVDRIRDANDIKRVQRAYGFYVDKGMWDDVGDLFTAEHHGRIRE